MKKLLLPFLLLAVINTSAQKINKTDTLSAHSIHIIGDNFEGAIFNKDYNSAWLKFKRIRGVFYVDGPSSDNDTLNYTQRFTPSLGEIILLENLLQRGLKSLNKKEIHEKYLKGPTVYKHLKKYVRQYFGFVNEKGEKIGFINCFWNDMDRKDIKGWSDAYYHVYDGGSYYWQIKINLNTHKLYDFGVNGAL